MWRNLISMWKSDNLLEQAWSQSFEMLTITWEMFQEAVRVLREENNTILNKEVRDKDKKVNRFQQDVRRKVLTHCAVQGSCDLASAMVLVNVVIDIERIGDYTKNIVDLASSHVSRLAGGLFENSLVKVEEAVQEAFQQTRQIIVKSDVEAARALLKSYEWVNPECDQRCNELIHEKDHSLHSGDAATLALYFRSLKRINSHLRNIVTSVVNPFDRIGYNPDKPLEDID